MKLHEIELLASKNQPLPSPSNISQICLYTTLRALYQSYRHGEISLESAKNEKQKIISKCKELEKMCEKYNEVFAYHQENIRRAGMLLSEIEKSRDVTEIMLKSCECIGIMTGDENFLKRQKKKLKKECETYEM